MCAETDSDKQFMQTVPYREAVGSFMYLMTGTRQNMAFFLRQVSQFLVNPGIQHWRAI